jgi:mannose-6-phosphate isomerase-like protein (cupin superfamily)
MTLYQEVFSTAHCGPAPARAPQDRTTEQDLLLWALSTQRTVTAPEGSGAEFTLIERLLPAGFASPAHIHHGSDEAFYVLEGEIRFQCGDKTIAARSGTFVYLPRQVPHTFRVGPAPARWLQFHSARAEAGVAPGPLSIARLLALAGKYQIELLLPPRP